MDHSAIILTISFVIMFAIMAFMICKIIVKARRWEKAINAIDDLNRTLDQHKTAITKPDIKILNTENSN